MGLAVLDYDHPGIPYFTQLYSDGLPLSQGLNTPQLLFGGTLRQ